MYLRKILSKIVILGALVYLPFIATENVVNSAQTQAPSSLVAEHGGHGEHGEHGGHEGFHGGGDFDHGRGFGYGYGNRDFDNYGGFYGNGYGNGYGGGVYAPYYDNGYGGGYNDYDDYYNGGGVSFGIGL